MLSQRKKKKTKYKGIALGECFPAVKHWTWEHGEHLNELHVTGGDNII